MQLLVRSTAVVAEDILSLELVAPQGGPLVPFSAGAHIDLQLGNGCIRSYSLVNDSAERERYVVAVQKDPGSRGGSRYVHEQLRAGSLLEVGAPRNNFALAEDAPLSVFFAGGIGITPLWCMIQRLAALGRPWKLVYAVRSRRKCAYLPQIEALEAGEPGRVHLHIDEEQGGLPVDLAAAVAQVPAGAHLYCCGPAPMLKAFEQAAAARPAAQVHLEYFSATQEAAVAGGFEVKLARSQRAVRVAPGKSILQTLLDCGIAVSHACQEGVCGACQTTVLQGEPDHRDAYLSPQEKKSGKTMLLCCSGSKGDVLVLDL
jgi:ferredoxin-NADP reductase